MKSKNNEEQEKAQDSEEIVSPVSTPEDEIQKLKSEVEEYNEKFLRVVADFDNFRKRIERDRGQQSLRLRGEVVSSFLEVIDTVERAIVVDYPDLESSQKGILEIHKLISIFMESFDIKRFKAPNNVESDVNCHFPHGDV